jgi:hypothetical protein
MQRERPGRVRAHTGYGRFESDVCRNQDRAHQDKRDNQFSNKCDGVAVNARYSGRVKNRVVCQPALQHKLGDLHAGDGARQLRGAVEHRIPQRYFPQSIKRECNRGIEVRSGLFAPR